MATIDADFLFDNNLIAEVENLIRSAETKLLLVSPYIDLDSRIQDALREKKERHDFSIQVLFGKNEDNIYRSIKRNSIEFLKDFPNIEIRYNDRLHAKFYMNDYDFILTSLNLYDFSLAKNIEVGIKVNYAYKGILNKALGTPDALLSQGVDKIKENVFGMGKELDPIEKFGTIFNNSVLKYKTQPKISAKSGFVGVFGGKKLDGYEVAVNDLDAKSEEKNNYPVKRNDEISVSKSASLEYSTVKFLSASQISKLLGVAQPEIISFMQGKGLIIKDRITPFGVSKGLILKKYMGQEYIGYPENLEELKELRK
ncbi:hypothetical protein GXP67_01285 [Rhodocytophaga rosea]|uniref:Phospholipase D-like domain-containing protein n=1 Tax=Rhodocytophaga rosea TaxID=2704465 RepID=A0A6C0GC30_9BACT|nr:phospholipase D-like domain-containing protein [Rhodocytophaga rosea]QHT65404.1 hypothetical protein GXP67_01285 [Rhodocytophaga rosea]